MTAVVSIFGRLAADARVSTMQNGGAMFNFRVASNARAKRDGQWTDVTTWWSVTLFVGDRQVDYYSRSLVKGAQVYLSGQTHQDTYINSSGEEKTSMMVIYALMKPCSDLTFAMRVVGNSMTASSGLSFPEDTVIYVDPQKPHENGSFVVAKINGSVTFKRLVIDGGASLLIPLNPQYPSITVTNEVEIIGSVIGAYTDL